MARPPTDQAETRTNPDPSILTTEQILREINSLKSIIDARIDGLDKSINGIEKYIATRQEGIDSTVDHLKTLQDEKFRSIETQLTAGKEATSEQNRSNKIAVDAAFAAAKEAVAEQNKSNALSITKSETAFTKQIDAIGINIDTTTKGINDKIEDIKVRLTAVDNRLTALDNRANGKTEGISSVGAIVLGAFTGLSSLAAVAAIIIAIRN